MKGREPLKALESLQQSYNQLQTNYEQLQQENALLQKALAEAREQVAKQQEDMTQILERVKHLEGQAAKDSHNSSKPPSTICLLESPPLLFSMVRWSKLWRCIFRACICCQ
jgi:septal ring factor EnvC (AmiA/AmiB activator)